MEELHWPILPRGLDLSTNMIRSGEFRKSSPIDQKLRGCIEEFYSLAA